MSGQDCVRRHSMLMQPDAKARLHRPGNLSQIGSFGASNVTLHRVAEY
jgi:hypothetical protein